jgi:division protein CdvB (Snf7/Vps24/ESCRT-III family)
LSQQVADLQNSMDLKQRENEEQLETIKRLTTQVETMNSSLEQSTHEAEEQQKSIRDLTEQMHTIVTEDGSLLLENINGLTSADAARLKAAGIGSVKALAFATPAQVEAALKPPPWRKPDYDKWIRYARILSRMR